MKPEDREFLIKAVTADPSPENRKALAAEVRRITAKNENAWTSGAGVYYFIGGAHDTTYGGGNMWESPFYVRVLISLAGDGRLMLISNPDDCGSVALVEPNGRWLYTLEELRDKLKDWRWIGKRGVRGSNA